MRIAVARGMDDLASTIAMQAARGPRYTSYPPATEMGPIHLARVRHEVARVGAGPVSLYVHVPFCRSLCAYCGCNVIPTRDASRGDAYVDQLATEMTLIGITAPVTEIALGGGSPNFLSPQGLRTLVRYIERYFAVQADARRSIELDPRTTTSAQIDVLGELGFSSVSLGVQDFAMPVQDAIRRHQSVAQTRWLVERMRAAGADDINIDMVYGLPRQSVESFAQTLDEVIALAPDRVALFGYAHLPDRLPHQRIVERAGRVLDAYERAELLVLGTERFAAAGYVHVGLDHFARPASRLAVAARERRLARSFQGYVEKRADTIIGLGVSAISSTPRMFWQNHAALPAWEQAIASQRLGVARGLVLDGDDRLRRDVIERLMCDGEVTLSDPHYFAAELAELATMETLVRVDGPRLFTTSLGKLLVRNICMVFDRYRQGHGEQRFSSTI